MNKIYIIFKKLEKVFKTLVAEIFREENPQSVSFFDKFNSIIEKYDLFDLNYLVKKLKEKQKKIIINIFQLLNIISIVILEKKNSLIFLYSY